MTFWQKWTGQQLHELSDDELMEKLADGHSKSFETLFDRHSNKVLGYCHRLLGELQRAEDISQDVWMKVIHASSSYEKKGNFIAWVHTIARNTCFTHMKKSSDWTPIEEVSNMDSGELSFDFELQKNEDIQKLKKLIDQLPSQQRAVLVLHINDELSYEDISRELNISLSAVKSLLFRARKNLSESWEKAS